MGMYTGVAAAASSVASRAAGDSSTSPTMDCGGVAGAATNRADAGCGVVERALAGGGEAGGAAGRQSGAAGSRVSANAGAATTMFSSGTAAVGAATAAASTAAAATASSGATSPLMNARMAASLMRGSK